MKKKMFAKVMSMLLCASLIFTSVELNPLAAGAEAEGDVVATAEDADVAAAEMGAQKDRENLDLLTMQEEVAETFVGDELLLDGTESEDLVVAVTGVSIANNSSTGFALNKGKTLTLTAEVTPSNAANKTVTWTSSNTKVATVDKDGVVTGVKAGTATITVKTETDDANTVSYTAKCTVTVKEVPATALSISFNGKAIGEAGISVNQANTLTLTPVFTPADATTTAVKWKSSDTEVATVDSTGKVIPVASGNAVITVTATETDTPLVSECKIRVLSGNGTDSISANTPAVDNTAGTGTDDKKEEEQEKETYTLNVTYGQNGKVEVGNTSSVEDSDISSSKIKNKKTIFSITAKEDSNVILKATPEDDYGVGTVTVELPDSEYTLEEVSGNEVKTEDGNITISEPDKNGVVTVTIKSVSANANITVTFKQTIFDATLKIGTSSSIAVRLENGVLLNAATGEKLTEMPSASKAGYIFEGWQTDDGTAVTLDNLAEVLAAKKQVSAKFATVNMVTKQKMNITSMFGLSANVVASKYKVFLEDGVTSGSAYLSVDKKGIATAKSKTRKVKVVAYNANNQEVGSCIINVVKPVLKSSKEMPVVTKASQVVSMNQYISDLPTNSSTLTWTVGNEKIAKIDKDTGVLTINGTASGKVTVFANFSYSYTAANGLTKTAVTKVKTTVTVLLPKAGKTTVSVKNGKTVSLKMTNLNGQKVEWKLSSGSRLKIEETKDTTKMSTCKIKGLKVGTQTVTATVDGTTYTFNVTVK